MSNLKKASDDIKKFGVMFSGLVALANEIDKIESIENYNKELEKAKDVLLKGNMELSTENAQILLHMDENKLKSKDILEKAKIHVDTILKEKIDKGDLYIAAAMSEAKKIADESVAVLEKIESDKLVLAELAIEIEKQDKRLKTIEKQVEKLKAL